MVAEQAAVAVMHQHDDGGVGAREMLGAAGRVGAFADMAAGDARGRRTAHAAEAGAPVPVRQGAGIGEHAAFLAVHQRADRAQVDELAVRVQEPSAARLLDVRQVEGEMGGAVPSPRKMRVHSRPLHSVDAQECGVQVRLLDDQALRAPDRQQPGVRGRPAARRSSFRRAAARRTGQAPGWRRN